MPKKNIYIYIYHGDSGKKRQAVKKGNPGKQESKNIQKTLHQKLHTKNMVLGNFWRETGALKIYIPSKLRN